MLSFLYKGCSICPCRRPPHCTKLMMFHLFCCTSQCSTTDILQLYLLCYPPPHSTMHVPSALSPRCTRYVPLQDGTLRLWDYHTGGLIAVTDCSPQLAGSPSPKSHCAASSEKQSNGSDGGAAGADRVCVRCVTCCQKKDVIAVSFYL